MIEKIKSFFKPKVQKAEIELEIPGTTELDVIKVIKILQLEGYEPQVKDGNSKAVFIKVNKKRVTDYMRE